MNMAFTFSPGKDSFFALHKMAKERGITVSPFGKITIRRRDWTAGQNRLVSVTFLTYREAIRSLRHTVDGIFASSRFRRGLANELRLFHAWLLEQDHDSPVGKKAKAEQWLLSMVSALTVVRCQNLVALRRELNDAGEVSRSLQELLKEKRWGAACCKLIYRLNPDASTEVRRVLEQVPKILEREQILGKLWTHDIWRASTLRQEAIAFGRHYDRVIRENDLGPSDFEHLQKRLDDLLVSFGKPFDHRLKAARKNLVSVRDSLMAVGVPTDGGRVPLRKALLNLKRYENWLHLSDSRDGMTESRKQCFLAVA